MRRVNVVERVAQTATLYSFEIELANVDRGVYATLAFRIAQHPSEAPDSLVARVLAYCCEYTDGIQFSPGGLSDPDEPPLSVRDATGRLLVWIDIGVQKRRATLARGSDVYGAPQRFFTFFIVLVR